MVSVGCNGHIVVEIDAEALGKALWGVLLSFEGECLRTFSEVSVEYALQSHFPLG